MPDVEPLRFPSREGRTSQHDQADLQAVCSGRRRTCALLNSPSPHVNSAIYHLQDLRMIVENWYQQSGKYQPQTKQDKDQYSKTLRFQSRDSDTDALTSAALFVEGIAISARESCPFSPLLKKINDVIGETVYLIERLEADRQYAEEALQKEKRRKGFLEDEVESLSLWKQQEHSFVVQREHEACIRDINELKWQLKIEKDTLLQAKDKLSNTEVLNQRLKEDISFAKKQVPIVKGNMEVQRGIIKEINTAQSKADEVCSKTQSDLTQAKIALKKMELEANNEKKSQDHTLMSMKNQLANKLENLKSLKLFEKSVCAETEDAVRMITLTEEKCAEISQRIPELTELEKTEKKKISDLNCGIEEEVHKNKKLQEKLISLQEHLEKTRLSGEADISCIEEQLLSKRNTFAALCKENMEFEKDVEDYRRKLTESEKAARQMREQRKQMLQKIIDNDEQWEKADEEVTQVVAKHSDTQAKLQKQEQLTFMEAQKARKKIENLRKDLTSQMTSLELIKGQCESLNEKLNQHQRNSALTNEILQKDFDDASSTAKTLEKEVEEINQLIEDFERIEREHMNTLADLDKEKKLRCDQLKDAQDLQTATLKRYDNTLNRISDLTKKCKEYQDASDEMERMAEIMPEAIAELQSVFDMVEFKNKSASLIMSTLQSDINNCQQRTQRSMQTHTAHVTARKQAREDTKEALKSALEENKQLATEYESLKKIRMETRQEAVTALHEKNHAHKLFTYRSQLSLLQKRMHKALVKYFKQRSLYSQAELDRCQALSQETDQKIKTAQCRYSTGWKHILFHTTVTQCYAWHCLSLIRLVSCLVSFLPSKGIQANTHQCFVPCCYDRVKDTTLTLQSIHSLIRLQTHVMDDASARVPMQGLHG